MALLLPLKVQRSVIYAVVSVSMVVAFLFGFGLVLILLDPTDTPAADYPLMHVYAGISLCILTVPVGWFLARRIKYRTEVVLSNDGVSAPVYYRGQTILWADITNVRKIRVRGETYISLDIETAAPATRRSRVLRALGLGSIVFGTTGTGVNPRALFALISERIASARRQ